MTKILRKPFKSIEYNFELLELIHIDIFDFKGILTRGGNHYFITFIGNFFKYSYVFLMKHKSEAFEKFIIFLKEVENKTSKKIKGFKVIGVWNMVLLILIILFNLMILYKVIALYSPSSKGAVRRKNKTLIYLVNLMLISFSAPKMFYGEAVLSVNFILNRIPYKTFILTLYELCRGYELKLDFLRVWGYLSFVKLYDPKRPKLGKLLLVFFRLFLE